MLSYKEIAAMERAWRNSGKPREPFTLVTALVERYPFLETRLPGSGGGPRQARRSQKSRLVEMPRTWRDAIGLEFAEDLRTVLLALGGRKLLEDYRVDLVAPGIEGLDWEARFLSETPSAQVVPVFEVDGVTIDYLACIEEVYRSICGHICIECGAMGGLRRSEIDAMPICKKEKGYGNARPLEPVSRNGEFCVWTHYANSDGSLRDVSYKDLVVGKNAPVVRDLGLDSPLLVGEVWERLVAAEEGTAVQNVPAAVR